MIRTIQHIRRFGVFSHFRWPADVPEFKKYNLIYGWNYSGKTTLSRVFRCFELKETHPDFGDAEVQLTAADGTLHLSAPHTAPAFRVFNTDFVRDNLSFQAGTATPVLVLGSADIATQQLLQAKKAERQELASRRDQSETEAQETRSAISKALSRYARDAIKNPLAKPNYDKTNFEPVVARCSANAGNYLLQEDELEQYLAIFRSTEKKAALSAKRVALSSVAELEAAVASVLARIVAEGKPIARLKDDRAAEIWVNQGRSLHEGKPTCLFCGQQLPADLMVHLSSHFSAEYDHLMAELRALETRIRAAAEETIDQDHKNDFYPELSERFVGYSARLEKLLETRKSSLETLLRVLGEKKTQAFTRLECPAVNDPSPEISAAVQGINDIISAHNTRTTEFDRKKSEAFAKIEEHYAAQFACDQQYSQQGERIASLDAAAGGLREKLRNLDEEIQRLERSLSDAAKGAAQINQLLTACFGTGNLRIEVSAAKRFQILRGDVVAKNLSEGETTAIAFAYFVTCVEDGRVPLAETIVVVDDPVSSLDANHIFNTYALVKTRLAGCQQLFIFTHSFEFYNLIREWALEREEVKKPVGEWKEWAVFRVERRDDGTAVIEGIPRELLRFKSEFHYLFSTLYHFRMAAGGNFDCLLGLPNIVRRFMEAFGGIMIPLSISLKKKMERLFSDEVERERVWKFLNYYSHNTTITRSLAIPDVSECRVVVDACLRAVEEWNPKYFKDLETEVI